MTHPSLIPCRFLQDVVEAVHHRQLKPQGFSARLKEAARSTSTSDEIIRFRNRLREVRSNFMVRTIYLILPILRLSSCLAHGNDGHKFPSAKSFDTDFTGYTPTGYVSC
jgi:hypothetical protein